MTIHDVRSDGLLLSISQSCQALEVSRSGYYKWRIKPEIVPSVNMDLKNQIQEIALEFTGYGYMRMTTELQNRGFEVNRKCVLRLMRQDSLLCKKKRFKPITFEDAYRNIWHFIEKVYNKKRLHSVLGYRSPEQFEVELALKYCCLTNCLLSGVQSTAKSCPHQHILTQHVQNG